MKKIIFLISLLFVSAIFAQEAPEAENEDGNTVEPAQEAAEDAPAKADDDKITVSKEELAKLVREAVADEMAKKEAEKKEAAKEGREPEKVIEGPRERLNREVIELADSGLEPVEIARKLKMGVGEVGLILGLHGR